MPSSAASLAESDSGYGSSSVPRPEKRIKLWHGGPEAGDEAGNAVARHPLGVKPAGNAFTSPINLKDRAGFFATWPDELWMLLLEGLAARELLALGATCKALYAFARSDELWRALFIQESPEPFSWRGSWRSTYLALPAEHESHVDCTGLFSDVLHRPFFCTVTPLAPYAANIPPENRIARLADLSQQAFAEHWSAKPFILTEPVKQWPAYKDWTVDSLLQKHAKTKFRAEAVEWQLDDYLSYMTNTADESPLYLFDRSFAEKMGVTAQKSDPDAVYWPPECFGEDLFAVLGEQRPHSRWLIVGPPRSGSTFHKDPNGTSAWNAVLTGSKYWLMFPSSPSLPPPPGVILSADQSEITSPLSIAEYLVSFHAVARATPGCREGICHAGEVLHVPSGWFHLVLNLDASIAITQNFVPAKKLADVIRFLRDSPDQVSGFGAEVADPYGLFVARLRETHPGVVEEALAAADARGKKGRWEELVRAAEADEADGSGFSFGFGVDDGDEVS